MINFNGFLFISSLILTYVNKGYSMFFMLLRNNSRRGANDGEKTSSYGHIRYAQTTGNCLMQRKDGQNNALVVAYASNCSYDPPMAMVGIVPSRHSYKLIKESGCFIINLAAPYNKEAYDYLGSHSGRDEDKIAKLQMNIEDGRVVDAPILLDCPVNIECTIVDS